MRDSTIQKASEELRATYGPGLNEAREGKRWLLRIDSVELYPGCHPTATPMLLVFDPDQPKPLVFVRPGQLLANGRVPKNSSNVIVGGETWMQFSFNIPWADGDSIVRFVGSARQRFAQNE